MHQEHPVSKVKKRNFNKVDGGAEHMDVAEYIEGA